MIDELLATDESDDHIHDIVEKMAELVLDNNHSLTQFVFCVICLLSRINRFLLFCVVFPVKKKKTGTDSVF
jgi:hypothetical protein